MHIAGAGGSVTHTLRARAVMVRKSAGAGRSGMKKTVPRRSLVCTECKQHLFTQKLYIGCGTTFFKNYYRGHIIPPGVSVISR